MIFNSNRSLIWNIVDIVYRNSNQSIFIGLSMWIFIVCVPADNCRFDTVKSLYVVQFPVVVTTGFNCAPPSKERANFPSFSAAARTLTVETFSWTLNVYWIQSPPEVLRSELSRERATRLEGSFGTQKQHYSLARIKARNRKTEMLWIFFGIHTANAVCMIEKVEKKKRTAA
jgi:hypothetical protein